MHVSHITDYNQWERFVKAQPFPQFVQSPTYIEFYKAMGENGHIFGIFDEAKQLIGGCLAVTTHAKRGNFLYIPYGPYLPSQKTQQALELLTQTIATYGKEQGFHFIRMSPFIDNTPAQQALFAKVGYTKAPMHVLAETTWLLDITKPEDELLMDMKKNHRNLIRRCEREGVTITTHSDVASLNDLHTLMDITAKRHGFQPFSRSYIEQEFAAFAARDEALVYKAYLPTGELDAVSIIMFYENMASYRHSGSLNQNKKLPTSYVIQWEAIKEAKRRGMRYYNFWGVAPEDASPSHPFFGIRHFKKGFGGFQKDVIECQDYPLESRYYLTKLFETVRKWRRGF